ncbi:MAG: hypothetical protein IE889_05305 [Campylobacterales bacterium]|nr:hypothetical protein [Campylobacterales bacterium]
MKKILLSVLLIILVSVGLLFLINGKDNYDPTQYEVTATNGLHVGSKLTLKLPDQFDQPHALTNQTQKLILVFAKDTGHTVKAFLNQQGADFLEKRHTLFVADISPMPTVIRNTFVLPDLQKSHYAVLLNYDGTIRDTLKDTNNADKITIATVKNGVIETVKYISTAEELEAELLTK